jgi:hypothetical protein
MAIREGARADEGWEEGARREGMDMHGIFTGECCSAVPPGQTPHDSFTRQHPPMYTKQVPYGHRQRTIHHR